MRIPPSLLNVCQIPTHKHKTARHDTLVRIVKVNKKKKSEFNRRTCGQHVVVVVVVLPLVVNIESHVGNNNYTNTHTRCAHS